MVAAVVGDHPPVPGLVASRARGPCHLDAAAVALPRPARQGAHVAVERPDGLDPGPRVHVTMVVADLVETRGLVETARGRVLGVYEVPRRRLQVTSGGDTVALGDVVEEGGQMGLEATRLRPLQAPDHADKAEPVGDIGLRQALPPPDIQGGPHVVASPDDVVGHGPRVVP